MKKIKIIAEIGWNHMGDMNLAEKMVEAAAHSGADFCKFQTWSEKNLKPGPWDSDGRREIYTKAELSEDDHKFLINVCSDYGVSFFTSVFNINDLEFLSTLDLKYIKIPSHEINNLELISQSAKLFENVLVSTGASKWSEIEDIKNNIKSDNLIYMHCVSTYPCPSEKINLPRMKKLREFSLDIGYSGHYTGIEDSVAAISNGATYIEKHFTIDQNLPGRDNKFAILPDKMKALCEYRDLYQDMSIDKGLDLQECEMDTFENYRGRWSKGA